MNAPKPVRRAFTGRLVGLPPDAPEDNPFTSPELAPAKPVSPPQKRGRKPKGHQAMSTADRQRQSRARKRQAETAPERERLIRLIVRRVKTSEHANISAMQRALTKFHDSLHVLTVEDLRDIAKAYTILHDRKGRSRIEGQTGTALVAGEFIDRIERIFSKSVTQMLYGGQKPAMGASPSVDDESDDDHGKSTSRAPMKSSEVTIWDLIPQITEAMFDGEEEDMWNVEESTLNRLPSLTCRACQHTCCAWTVARRHAEEMLQAVKKQADYIRTLEEATDKSDNYDSVLADAKRYYQERLYCHELLARNFVTDGGNRKSSPRY